jgi:uncharacterized protein (TIGR00730 family)
MSFKSICVVCGGNGGIVPAHREAARSLGVTLAKEGLELVYGGLNVGMMGIIADATLAQGGEVFGVAPESFLAHGLVHRGLTKIEIVSSMQERKAMMIARADAFIALPGGFGTIDELFEILTLAQLHLHEKPCAVLNVAGYFDGLIAFLDGAEADGLLRPINRAKLLVEIDPVRLIRRFRAHIKAHEPRKPPSYGAALRAAFGLNKEARAERKKAKEEAAAVSAKGGESVEVPTAGPVE